MIYGFVGFSVARTQIHNRRVVRSPYRGNATDWNRLRAPRAAKARPSPAALAEHVVLRPP